MKNDIRSISNPPQSLLGVPSSRDESIQALTRFEKVPDTLVALLALPDKLYSHSKNIFPSLSTDPTQGVDRLSNHLARVAKDPKLNPIQESLFAEMPGYAFLLYKDGSDFFCTLIDKSRSIVVFDIAMPLPEGLHDERPGAWAGFEIAITKALEEAHKISGETGTLGGDSQKFVVVVRGEIQFVPAERC